VRPLESRPSARLPPAAIIDEVVRLYKNNQYSDAASMAACALQERPGDARLWNARGVCLRSLRQPAAAIECYQRALETDPHDAGVWSNLGNALKDVKQVVSAITCHRRAVELAPHSPDFWHNLGIALLADNRPREAVDAFDEALRWRPDDPKIRWDRSHALLRLGDYRRGWRDYEARLLTGALPKRELRSMAWTGQRYTGKRLVILSEQGFGDTIWAARYFAQAKRLGGELVVECRPELVSLIRQIGAVDRVVPRGQPLPEAEYHCYVCSLPGLFTPEVAAIPPAPYLAPPGGDRPGNAVVASARGKLRVGIVWSGSTTFEGNVDRAVPLQRFVQAFALPGVQLFSLQKGEPRTELQSLSGRSCVIDLAPYMSDFADTAALVRELDLVIMTDSAVAHLCGALGTPVWILLNHVPYWLWLLGREDSPWYPSARLFRARTWGDWDGVFDAASAELLRIPRNRMQGSAAALGVGFSHRPRAG